jgi:hypothetical protein
MDFFDQFLLWFTASFTSPTSMDPSVFSPCGVVIAVIGALIVFVLLDMHHEVRQW